METGPVGVVVIVITVKDEVVSEGDWAMVDACVGITSTVADVFISADVVDNIELVEGVEVSRVVVIIEDDIALESVVLESDIEVDAVVVDDTVVGTVASEDVCGLEADTVDAYGGGRAATVVIGMMEEGVVEVLEAVVVDVGAVAMVVIGVMEEGVVEVLEVVAVDGGTVATVLRGVMEGVVKVLKVVDMSRAELVVTMTCVLDCTCVVEGDVELDNDAVDPTVSVRR